MRSLKVVAPVPPPATESVPLVEGVKVSVSPDPTIVIADVMPFVVEVVVARVMLDPLCPCPAGPMEAMPDPSPDDERHTPLIAKHPPERFNPFDAVEVALPVRLSASPEIPPEKVEVEVLETARFEMVVVPAESVLSTASVLYNRAAPLA